jgi:hypothetical protein
MCIGFLVYMLVFWNVTLCMWQFNISWCFEAKSEYVKLATAQFNIPNTRILNSVAVESSDLSLILIQISIRINS